MKKKVLSALLVAAMSVSVLAGCGSKADNNTDAKNDASQENTLSVWCWDPNFNVYAMKQAEAIYQKDHPDFKLDIQEKVYSDIETALITMGYHLITVLQSWQSVKTWLRQLVLQ